MTIEAQARRATIPGWAWAILAALIAYQAVMYGWVMRVYMHLSVVLLPWLLHQPGYRLYENIILPYMPGSLWLNAALYTLAPEHLVRVRLAMIVLAAITTGLTFWLGRRWWGPHGGLAAATLTAAWGPVVTDHPMYFEVLLGLLALIAIAIWHKVDSPRWRPILAGLIVGLALLIKQQALAVMAVFVIWRILGTRLCDWRAALTDLGLFLMMTALPVGLLILTWASQGRLDDALFWTWTYSLSQPYEARSVLEIGLREWAVIVAWLALIPLFAVYVIPQREQWRREGILLLGLIPVLCSPIYPRYGRFHLSGAVAMVALAGAGALVYSFQAVRERGGWFRHALRLYGMGAAGLIVVALALPISYRLRLGPLTGEYEALIPIAEWLFEETEADSETRVWMLPSTDPTDNFHAISGTLPPTVVAQTYPWFHSVPGLTDRVIEGIEADPPQYAIVVEKWRNEIPDELLGYLDAHYAPIGEMAMPYEDYGERVTFYELVP